MQNATPPNVSRIQLAYASERTTLCWSQRPSTRPATHATRARKIGHSENMLAVKLLKILMLGSDAERTDKSRQATRHAPKILE